MTVGKVHALGVRTSSVVKSYEGECVLSEIDLSVSAGSFTVLVGPSGCGKTTLLRLLGGLETPSSGQIDWLEPDGPADAAMTQRIGYCFQEPRLLPWRTVLENVLLPLELMGDVNADAATKAMDALALVGLRAHAHKRPHQLSGGMQMRVSIARAMVTQPQLLLLDEPFAALDEISRVRMDDELLSLWSETGVTVVMVTHSLTEAVYLGQDVHFMAANPGRIVDTLSVQLERRTPEIRSSTAFAEWVALAHGMLAIAEGHGS